MLTFWELCDEVDDGDNAVNGVDDVGDEYGDDDGDM